MGSLPLEAFTNSNIWLVYEQENTLLSSKIHFPIDSQVYIFKEESSGRIRIEEVYQVTRTSRTLILPFGSWSKDNGLTISEEPLEERRSDLQGLVLRGQTLPEPPYTEVETKNGHVAHIAQCAFWVLRWPCGQKLKSKNTLSDGKKMFLRLFFLCCFRKKTLKLVSLFIFRH